MNQLFFYTSIIFGFIGQGIGIYSILKGIYKPQRTTRFIYFLMSIIFMGTLIATKSWDALGFAAAQNIGGAIIFLLSFKYGIGGYEKLDILTLCGALLTGLTWILTDNPVIALFMAISTDFIAFIPTLIKMFKLPHTEDWRFYISDVIGSSFSILSIKNFGIGEVAYPAYILLINTCATLILIIRNKGLKVGK